MTERRTLTVLLLLVLAAAGYLWWRQTGTPAANAKGPEKVEAEERAKAEPFPSKP